MANNLSIMSEEETTVCLQIMKDLNIMQFIDGRTHRNGDIFKKVAERLKEAGFVRTVD